MCKKLQCYMAAKMDAHVILSRTSYTPAQLHKRLCT